MIPKQANRVVLVLKRVWQWVILAIIFCFSLGVLVFLTIIKGKSPP